jgi:3-dehydroquinate synthetase
MAARRGAEAGLAERIDEVIARLGYARTRRFDPDAVKVALRGDKKRLRGRQRWILPMAVGRMLEVDDVTDEELAGAMRHIHAEGS